MPSKLYPEIDLLRGVGVAMMIANHFGYGLLSAGGLASPTGSALVLVGSFAPVLFFFTTGIGVGVHRGRPAKLVKVGFKVAILFAADAIMVLAYTGEFGFDFLAFIGLSTFVCALLTHSKRPLLLSVTGFCAFAILRFGLGVALRHYLTHDQLYRASLLVGVESIRGIAYPLAPWLCFPFFGFCLSPVIEETQGNAARLKRSWVMLMCGATALATSWIAVRNGSYFIRYSTVSAAFFAASLGVLLMSTAVCQLATHAKTTLFANVPRFFEIRGVACLAIVPIHYLLLAAVQSVGMTKLSASEFIVAIVVAIPVCFLLGRGFERLALAITGARSEKIVTGAMPFLFVIAATVSFFANSHVQRVGAMFCGQAALCVMLCDVESRSRKGDNRRSTANNMSVAAH